MDVHSSNMLCAYLYKLLFPIYHMDLKQWKVRWLLEYTIKQIRQQIAQISVNPWIK